MDKKEQQTQQMRISDEEISMLKSTFAENDVLLKSVRKAMLGLPMAEDERKYVNELFRNEALHKLMRKQFLPELEGDTPLGQNFDLWINLAVSDRTPEIAHLLMKSRKLLIEMLEQGLLQLRSPGHVSQIYFEPTDDAEDDFIRLTARNTYVLHVDQQLMHTKILAGQKSESVEETKKRLAKDSNK